MTLPAMQTVEASNLAHYRASTDAATICRDIVITTAKDIQGRKYVQVEGWQAIAIAHGCAASACNVERIDGGYRATGQVRRMSDGAVIAEAEGFVGEDEPTWFGGVTMSYGKTKTLPKRADYAIRAMAQTRAISRACRSAFAHVVVMMNAGLSTTPAEEVPDGGFQDAHFEERAPQQAEVKQKPKAEPPKTPSLSERAAKVEAAMRAAETLQALNKTAALASGLFAQLDTADPERLAELQKLLAELEAAHVEALERDAA